LDGRSYGGDAAGASAETEEESVHHLKRLEEIVPIVAYESGSAGFTRCSLVDGSTGSVHMGLGLCRLDDGHVDTHLHSFEESFFVLEGEPVLYLDGRGIELGPGACGVVPVGVKHAWRADGAASWIDMMSPRPRPPEEPPDTFFVAPAPTSQAAPLDVRDPRNRHLFLLADWEMDVDELKAGAPVDQPTVSASMATALLAYSGIAVKMLVDQRLDAHLHTMFMVQYQPGGVAQPHDHPYEESYYMLEGEVEAVADGERYALRPGDVFWTGVGSIHAFCNKSGKRVKWLETSAPGPPDRHSYRFDRDWDYLDGQLAASQELHAQSTARPQPVRR
jgi:quercetin dioxygenase-like cupin family protein